jgi:DNA-binding CsgD family transcriptional regulator/PAS domain-containing protein
MRIFRTNAVNAGSGTNADIPGDILETIFEAVTDSAHWSSALSQIAAWVDAMGATYFLLDNDARVPRVSAIYFSGSASRAARAGFDAPCPTDLHFQLGGATLLQGWVDGARLWNVESNLACLAIDKPIDGYGFTDVERSRLSALTPHLGRATRLHRKFSSLALKAETGVEALNALSSGIVLVDAQGRVLFANTDAERLLRQRTIFKGTPAASLALCHAESHDALRRAVKGACNRSSAALQLCDRVGKPVICAIALPLPASCGWNLRRPLALLAMNEMKRTQPIPASWLSQLFGLTPTESQVANWLVWGRSIDEYAQHRGVSLETARSQVKAILSKAGVSKQSQLIAALAKLPVQQVAS